MKLLVLALVAAASAAPQGYNLGTPSGPSFNSGSCGNGQVRHVDGSCVTPQVNSRVFLYDVPANEGAINRPDYIPEPKLERNIIFVRLPDGADGPEPIVVPPPRQQHVVYVLNKQSEQDQRVIEVPAPPQSNPEVFFVNYAEGENPTLPSGVDLQTALSAASQGGGQVVGGGGIGGGIGGGLGGGFGGGSEAVSEVAVEAVSVAASEAVSVVASEAVSVVAAEAVSVVASEVVSAVAVEVVSVVAVEVAVTPLLLTSTAHHKGF
ncbi:uncharacterized protein LOC122242543 isoform X1 [Penaeus japonicus]|uniref:uncharacterized protein LOC122242543 isoform X1 n=1 Tax=Penaeus japonicus TaxID=27405 RepID=UPI001C714019|nr:uncharacterized protein LOC122242543 isoform X1 [Penaeus japonicus]